eukprot:COSAG01_NODE_29488_length_636_cov_1.156425_1_plen_72_part_10
MPRGERPGAPPLPSSSDPESAKAICVCSAQNTMATLRTHAGIRHPQTNEISRVLHHMTRLLLCPDIIQILPT